ncbi:MAG: type VI secretion system contractile sheath large subunit [Phycisphaeraceae bacterium]|nr:type VI secretion system contractile sheath large subunit [Phycisphaeraceae bacterium]
MSGMRGGMGFDLGFSAPGGGERRPDDGERPLRVLLLGDFGAGKQSAVAIQPAEIDQAIARLGIELEFEWEGEQQNLRVRSIDDFHPDSIAEQLPWMSRLLGLRKRIKDPANTVAALAEAKGLGLLVSDAPLVEPSAPQQPDQARTDTGGNDLAALLGRPTSAGSKPAAPQGVDIQSFIQKIVGSGPGRDSGVGAESTHAIRSIDRRLTTMMKAVLRSPRFARVESAWRALHNMVSNAWSEDEIGYEVLSADASHLEQLLSTDLSMFQSALAGHAAESAGPVDVILLVEPLRASESDLNTVHALSRLAATVDATLLLSVDAAFVGCPGFAIETDPARWTSPKQQPWWESWNRLKTSPDSSQLAAAIPRWLARRPYGLWSDPIDRFTFEELDAHERGNAAGHAAMCWAGGAWLLLRLIVEGWIENGDAMQLGSPCVVGDLPHTSWKDATGSHALPCAECYLAERGLEAISDAGLVPIASMKGRDAVVLGPVQNLAGGELRGRWT